MPYFRLAGSPVEGLDAIFKAIETGERIRQRDWERQQKAEEREWERQKERERARIAAQQYAGQKQYSTLRNRYIQNGMSESDANVRAFMDSADQLLAGSSPETRLSVMEKLTRPKEPEIVSKAGREFVRTPSGGFTALPQKESGIDPLVRAELNSLMSEERRAREAEAGAKTAPDMWKAQKYLQDIETRKQTLKKSISGGVEIAPSQSVLIPSAPPVLPSAPLSDIAPNVQTGAGAMATPSTAINPFVTVPTPTTIQFKSPQEVRNAFRAGKLTEDQAASILRNQFQGYK